MVDSAVYADGRRHASPATLADIYRCLQELDDAMAWIGLYQPSTGQLRSLAGEFQPHELAVEDAINAHQRPKLERYDHTVYAYRQPVAAVAPRPAGQPGFAWAADSVLVTRTKWVASPARPALPCNWIFSDPLTTGLHPA